VGVKYDLFGLYLSYVMGYGEKMHDITFKEKDS
jgi:hypothetical protein